MTAPPGASGPESPAPGRPGPAAPPTPLFPGMPAAPAAGGHWTVTELAAIAASRFARAQAAGPGVPRGRLGQWSDGIAATRTQRAPFARYWHARNQQALTRAGPLWVVLGDSTAQGLGAADPQSGYVGQAHAGLLRRTGQPWRVVNLSVSGALTRDVLRGQLPQLASLPAVPELVTCGVGANDILHTPPARLRATIRELIGALPQQAVILDLPLPAGFWGIIGRISTPYVTGINQLIDTAAGQRSLPVARLSAHFIPPWNGKFAPDHLHPSTAGHRDWACALLSAIPW
jgi:acyl-CoA thioesterase I